MDPRNWQSWRRQKQQTKIQQHGPIPQIERYSDGVYTSQSQRRRCQAVPVKSAPHHLYIHLTSGSVRAGIHQPKTWTSRSSFCSSITVNLQQQHLQSEITRYHILLYTYSIWANPMTTFYGFRSTDSQIHVAIALQSWVLETDESIHQLSSQVSSQDKTTRWFIWLASKFWVIKKLKGISFTRSNYFISEKTSSYVAPLTILKSDAANTPHVCVVAVNFSNSI